MANQITTSPKKPERYHPALVVLHWLILILIFATAFFALGGEGRRASGISIAGLQPTAIHMVLGILVLVLLLVRLIIRLLSGRPAWATTGSKILDVVGELTHWALYFFAFAVVITGLILALQTNRFSRAFGIGNNPPRQFQSRQFPAPGGQLQPGQFPSRGPEGGEEGFRGGGFFLGAFHGLSWIALFVLILFHAGAAFYHQFVVKDNLFSRMWFGKRYG
jgi:cytochrome b561